MKRKAEEKDGLAADGQDRKAKRQATEHNDSLQNHFSKDLFQLETVQRYADEYATSQPYKHGVVSDLIDDTLLRSVRQEIVNNIHFTPKETDIYKIHQSGDLANLDGLESSELKSLPSLLKLRDALYSYDFRQWLSTVTGAGLLSGKKTDMAINVYVPGCHLLCHDDVIGTRRVSYILYLLDPDTPWKAEWGGALRLYPTDEQIDQSGKVVKVPRVEWSKTIPPAWNQLSFFAVQPGESFHDVEEVYERTAKDSGDDGGRVRMAISGWFHIPQEGEEGFQPGLEEVLEEKSSLQQLEGRNQEFDEPQIRFIVPDDGGVPKIRARTWSLPSTPNDEWTADELELLKNYIAPTYLTPDATEQMRELFEDEYHLDLPNFLTPKFAESLRAWFAGDLVEEYETEMETATPPHKHRYRYMHEGPWFGADLIFPLDALRGHLLTSLAFRKWLAHATGLTLKRTAVLARRFRRGLDYQLAQKYEQDESQLEYTLCVTPTSGWGSAGEVVDDAGEDEANGDAEPPEVEENAFGGYETYMAGDEADEEDGSDDGVEIPAKLQSSTGAGDRKASKREKLDPAVYKAAEDDDDGILFSSSPAWNHFSVVLRDKGTQKFVKYVSASAPGDRWDLSGMFEVEEDDDDEDEGEGETDIEP